MVHSQCLILKVKINNLPRKNICLISTSKYASPIKGPSLPHYSKYIYIHRFVVYIGFQVILEQIPNT